MGERPVKIVEIDFALEGELVMKIKELKGDGSPWIYDGCGPQAKPEELSRDVNVLGLLTSTVIDGDGMNTVCMEDGGIEGGEARRWTRGAIMAELDAKAECLKRSSLKIVTCPLLLKEQVMNR